MCRRKVSDKEQTINKVMNVKIKEQRRQRMLVEAKHNALPTARDVRKNSRFNSVTSISSMSLDKSKRTFLFSFSKTRLLLQNFVLEMAIRYYLKGDKKEISYSQEFHEFSPRFPHLGQEPATGTTAVFLT